jgi:hypothetical protein
MSFSECPLSAGKVDVASVAGNILSPNNSLIAAIIATPLFAALYVCASEFLRNIFLKCGDAWPHELVAQKVISPGYPTSRYDTSES